MKYINIKGPEFFMFDVTSACNYRCVHCYNNSGQTMSDELTDDEVENIAKEISLFKPDSVCLCGGEPTLRNNLLDIIKTLSPSVGSVNMVSNGSKITYEFANELKAAGLNMLQISLDGANSFQHDNFRRCNGAFEKAVNAIKISKDVGFDTLVSFSVNEMNYLYLEEYLELLCTLKVEKVRFMPMIPMGRACNINNILLDSNQYAYFRNNINTFKNKCLSRGLDIEWGDPLDQFYRLPNNKNIGLKAPQFVIRANGDVAISPYLPYIVGNLRDNNLHYYWENGYSDIWYNKDFNTLIENMSDVNEINRFQGDDYYKFYIGEKKNAV
ncbi:radical SAM protein [Lachnospira multipara]|uniref:radical SAM protein n=1 Tax=Lachnospira multipara TaxID=28051 RepID=UPI0004275C6E|nr:radical SAM protein [Lachnospira multipara]